MNGWAGYRCKEKFKYLKSSLREWNKSYFGNFDEQIKQETGNIAGIDLTNELGYLTENDILLRSDGFSKIWKLMQRRESCLKQKSKTT